MEGLAEQPAALDKALERAFAWLDPQSATPPPPASATAVRAWLKGWKGEAVKKAVGSRSIGKPLAALLAAGAAQQAARAIPENFFADYQEFLPAYRAAFLHWLAVEAKSADGGKRCAARLLRARLERPEATLEELAQQTCGVALTGGDPAGKALERQFLAWLWRVKA